MTSYEEAVPNDGYVVVDGIYNKMEYAEPPRNSQDIVVVKEMYYYFGGFIVAYAREGDRQSLSYSSVAFTTTTGCIIPAVQSNITNSTL